MQSFIDNICRFIWNILNNLFLSIYNFVESQGVISNRIHLSVTDYNTFFDKQIISGDLINIGLTWRELLLYLIPVILITLFIVIFVKMILKIMGLFVELWQ